MSIILTAQKISKQYRLGLVGTGTLSHDLNRFWYKVRGKEDPYLKIGAENDRSVAASEDYVWALQDINFEVTKGEVLGIIGKNGAGKSTLLKILSRVTSPTTGVIRTKGRIASLLEVGTGFHPELTGRENIYLNGAILGMSKAEIKAKEEEIVDFSGCAMYIDTPVKRYSSGMRVRLAFAVAAHLEPDILVIDEVLAVGDAEFQKKAIGKMQDISLGDGRTVLFVSHNMAAVKSLCTRAIVLENGAIVFRGDTNEAVDFYLRKMSGGESKNRRIFTEDEFSSNSDFKLKELEVFQKGKKSNEPIERIYPIVFKLRLEKLKTAQLNVTLRFKDDDGNYLFVNSSAADIELTDFIGGSYIQMEIPGSFFNEGTFFVDLMIICNRKQRFLEDDILDFTVMQEDKKLGGWMGKNKGPLKPAFPWTLENINEG